VRLLGAGEGSASAGEVRVGPAGGKVTSYEESKFRNGLNMRPPGTDGTVTVEEYPSDRLMVRAYVECARYLSGTPMGAYGDPEPSRQ
jgi:hypothetical protein